MKNYVFASAVLIGGTFFAIGVGVASAVFSQTPYESISLALMAEIITVGLSIIIMLTELHGHIANWFRDHSVQHRASMMVSDLNDPEFRIRYRSCIAQLGKLANGSYKVETLGDLYNDDILSIDRMIKNSRLSSMCPVPGNEKQANTQLTDMNFVASVESHIKAVSRGVDVHRIYVFSSTSTFQEPVCMNHLRKVKNKRIDVRIILLDDERYSDAKKMPSDFIIFGSSKVSVGLLGPSSKVVGGVVYSDAESVNEWQREYERLFRISEPFA